MERDLIKFNELVKEIGSKDIVKYEDEKGNSILLPVSNVFLNCEYAELDEKQYKVGIFNKEIDKDIELEKIKVTRKKDKFEKTQNKKDMGILIDEEVEVYKVWLVRNGLKLTKAFNNKEEALKVVNETNNKYLKIAELIK